MNGYQFFKTAVRSDLIASNPFADLKGSVRAETYPMQVVCGWIGSTQPVAMKHYLQTTDEHFEKALQNPVQQTAASPRITQKQDTAAHDKTPGLQGFASSCDVVHKCRAPPVGLEPTTRRLTAACSTN